MMNQNGGSKADTLIKFVLIFFATLFSFSVGTYVGKKFSDSQHRMAAAGDKGHNTAAHDEAQDEALSEEDIASLTEEFVEKEKEAVDKEAGARDLASEKEAAEAQPTKAHPPKMAEHKVEIKADEYKAFPKNAAKDHAKDAHKDVHAAHSEPVKKAEAKGAKVEKKDDLDVQPPAMAGHSAATAAPSQAAKRILEGQPAADPAVKKERKPNSVYPGLAANTIGKYTVQIASYATEGEAQKHAESLKDKGIQAFYIPANVKGRTWFRVSVGLFESYKNANMYKDDLLKQAKIPSAIVQKIIE